MPIKKLALLITFLIGNYAYGQNKIDSLQNLLGSSTDSLKVEILNDLSKSLNHTDPEKSLKYAIEAKQLANELGDQVLIAKSINYAGVSYYYLNELDLSNESYFESLSIFDSIDFKPGLARVLNNIAWNYKVQNKFDDAINYFSQSLDIAEEIDDLDLRQGVLNNLGTAYQNTNRPDLALKIYFQSLKLNQQSGNRRWEAYNLNNIGMAYLALKQFDDAFEYFEKAKKINLENSYTQEYVLNILNIGRANVEIGNFVDANSYLDSANLIIDQQDLKRVKLEYYYYKVDLFKRSNNFDSAFYFKEMYDSLNNELNSIAWNEKVSEVQAKYDLAEKSRELEAAEGKVNRQKIVIIAGASFFLLLLGILLLVIKLYNSKNIWAKNIEKLSNEVKQKNEELQTMNEEVKGINNNLEQLVGDRTRKIKNQNEKLVRYAFINSHEIRGPLARVLGLLYLIGLEKKDFHEDESFQLLNEATHELDEVIKGTSELLEGEDIVSESKEKHS